MAISPRFTAISFSVFSGIGFSVSDVGRHYKPTSRIGKTVFRGFPPQREGLVSDSEGEKTTEIAAG